MKGTMLILRPGDIEKVEVKKYDGVAPTLEELKSALGGGYLEVVPGFFTMAYGGTVLNAVAMCDEDGKRKELPLNEAATIAWEAALRRQGSTLRGPGDRPKDYLVGTVIVLFGDKEFSESL
jgi:hypothetical protein